MGNPPTGTVTFLFTDIEGSTKLWEEYLEPMKATLAKHDALLHEAILAHQGHIIKTTGDGVHAVFTTARDAGAAVLDAQLALQAEPGERRAPCAFAWPCTRMKLRNAKATTVAPSSTARLA